LRRATPPLFHPNFGVFTLDYIADVVAPRSEDFKLITRVIDFKLVQTIWPWYLNVTDRQTDGQTDVRTTYDSNTALALCASRGNKTPVILQAKMRDATINMNKQLIISS